jgi:hypothetical protein
MILKQTVIILVICHLNILPLLGNLPYESGPILEASNASFP